MKSLPAKVHVLAPARLHMGFIDLSGHLGRHFGSIGVALNEINTSLTISPSPQLTISGHAPDRAESYTLKLCQVLSVSSQVNLEFQSFIPEHVGLGSGTQLALAIGMGLNAFYNLGLSIQDVAVLSNRGARSGIGIGVFERGGLIVDGGRGQHTKTPPVLSHMLIPEDWRFILVFDQRGQGLHGKAEVQAFQALPPFPQQESARLCYLLMMQGLPALAEQDIELFGDAITQLQLSVGEHFASAQGGVFTSQEVADAVYWLQSKGAVAIGQTSWGPTGFCAVPNPEQADILVNAAKAKFSQYQNLSFQIVSARNTGAEVRILA